MRRLVGAALVVAALAAPEVAHAGFTGSFDPMTGVLTLTGTSGNDQVTISVDDADRIVVEDENGAVTITGGDPTFNTTSHISIDAMGGEDVISVAAESLDGGGPPEPGQEAEIEVVANSGSGSDEFAYLGGVVADLLVAGQIAGGDAGLNVNGDNDGDDVRGNAETLRLELGGGADSVRSGPPFISPITGTLMVNGGSGNDSIDGGLGMSILNGNEDNDILGLLGGTNVVDGGAGMNSGFILFGGALTVNQNGGALNLSGSTVSGNMVQVLRDLVVLGSSANDTLNAGSVMIPMFIQPLGGNDTLVTGMAGDLVFAGPGNDMVRAGDGDDDLFGDQGDDELRGQGGMDNVDGGEGNDSCEGEVQMLCEMLIQDPAPNPGGGQQPGGGQEPGGGNPPGFQPNPLLTTPNPFLQSGFFQPFVREAQTEGINGILDANGFVVPFDAQPGVYEFSLRAELRRILGSQSAGPSQRRKQVVLAKGTKRVTTAGRVRVKLKLTRQGRKALRRARRAPVTLRAQYASPSGERYSASRRFTLERKRR